MAESMFGDAGGGERTVRSGFRYTGKVVGNNDPERCDRVQVSIPGLNDQLGPDMLPWYGNGNNNRTAGGKAASGSSFIPEIGSKVHVVFDTQDFNNGTYYPYPTTPDTRIPEAGIAYPNTAVMYRFPDGTVAFYNKPSKELCVRNPGGTLKIRTQGDTNLVCDSGNVNVKCVNATVHATATANTHSPRVLITTDDFDIVPYSGPGTPSVGPYP